MSVCVAATYPWKQIEDLPWLEAPGVIVCSDTRPSSNGVALAWKFNKQRLVARNILVCYTTSHGSATTLALHRSWGTKSVKRIGEELKSVHARLGGLTELIAVVWRGSNIPQILELMPPDYRPHARSGIVGIGDPGALAWFAENFRADPRPELEREVPTDDMLTALERQFGHRVDFPPPEYSIDSAALNVGAALASAIEQVGGATIGLPIQLMVVAAGTVRQVPLVAFADLQKPARHITVDHGATKLPPAQFARARKESGVRSAIQLFP